MQPGLRATLRYLPESGIVVASLILSGILFVREQRVIKLGIAQRFEEHLHQFSLEKDPFSEDCMDSVSQSTYSVLRDGQWATVRCVMSTEIGLFID